MFVLFCVQLVPYLSSSIWGIFFPSRHIFINCNDANIVIFLEQYEQFAIKMRFRITFTVFLKLADNVFPYILYIFIVRTRMSAR